MLIKNGILSRKAGIKGSENPESLKENGNNQA
jgi:hypothetical protein